MYLGVRLKEGTKNTLFIGLFGGSSCRFGLYHLELSSWPRGVARLSWLVP